MGEPVLIIGESGSGKTYAIKNLDPDKVGIFLCEKNRLPFRKPFPTYKVRNMRKEEEGKVTIYRQSVVIQSVLRGKKKEDLKKICVVLAEKLRCTFIVGFEENGDLYFETVKREDDFDFDDLVIAGNYHHLGDELYKGAKVDDILLQ